MTSILTYSAVEVNSYFSIENELLNEAILSLKKGLIVSINEAHPLYSEISRELISKYTHILLNFEEIFTTNYDTILYQIIMQSIDWYKENKTQFALQDYFWGPYNEYFKEFKDFQNIDHYKHVYYLHGALFLFRHKSYDIKILRKKHSKELIKVIEDEINKNFFPLFVSEGKSEDKLDYINRSSYLKFCLKRLEESELPLLIYGHSLSSFDEHITNAIKKTRRKVIYSVYTDSKSSEDIDFEIYNIIKLLQSRTDELIFIDSKSVFNKEIAD